QPARRPLPADRVQQAGREVEVQLRLGRLPLHPPGVADGDVLQPAQGAHAAVALPARGGAGEGRGGHDPPPVLLPGEHRDGVPHQPDHRLARAAGRPDRALARRLGSTVKIVLVGPTYPYKGGGAQHTTELAHRLAAAGHDVVIESWRAQYPSFLYPGRQTIDVPEGTPFPNTLRVLDWRRPDGWVRCRRRLRTAGMVVP